MKVSIITPGLNSLAYLQTCVASVADQAGVEKEHIVVDGASTDGTVEWLAQRGSTGSFRWLSEKDRGMYDAINKGLRVAGGDLLAYLNCDEQYLPGTLAFVADYFTCHPEIDILFGSVLLIRPDGSLLAYRKAYAPRWLYILTDHLYVLSCAMFFRRRILDQGTFFDPAWRDVGDVDFVVRVLRDGFRAAWTPRYLSAFTMTGANMSAADKARLEHERLRSRAPRWAQKTRWVLTGLRRVEKWLCGAYRQRWPLEYEVYQPGPSPQRVRFVAEGADFRWNTK